MSAEEVEFIPGHPSFGVTPPKSAKSVKFLDVPGDWASGWHPTPVRQFLVVLTGGFRVETSDGHARDFGPGEVVLLDDTVGKGHHTTMLNDSWIMAVALD